MTFVSVSQEAAQRPTDRTSDQGQKRAYAKPTLKREDPAPGTAVPRAKPEVVWSVLAEGLARSFEKKQRLRICYPGVIFDKEMSPDAIRQMSTANTPFHDDYNIRIFGRLGYSIGKTFGEVMDALDLSLEQIKILAAPPHDGESLTGAEFVARFKAIKVLAT